MQKLLVELKNTSGNAPQVPCSVSEALNREETLSVSRKVLANNSSAQDQHSGKSGQDLRVPVINMQKQLIPDGFDWIKIIIFKEVKRAILPPIEMGGLFAQLL
ncbi:MAG TPA: hypothetical protein ENH28_08285 [Euryarchaeota archaeon]|nr:hypothetical protein BMS3Bbin15_01394 [archaeon BMS3Bbin15]HDL16130.1 hypothetical protein [Euryarchaeota archaeon]